MATSKKQNKRSAEDMGTPLPTGNRVVLSSNGVLLVMESGQQTRQSLLLLQEEIADAVAQLRGKDQKVLILKDVSRVAGYDPDTSDIKRDLLLYLDFDSMAIFGTRKEFQPESYKLVESTHQQSKIKFFDLSADAARWLAGDVIQTMSAVESLSNPIMPTPRKKRTIDTPPTHHS